MKNLILLFCFMMVAGMAFGQLKMVSGGQGIFGDNTGVTPLGQVHIKRALNEAAQAIYADAPSSPTTFTATFSSLYLSNSNGTNNNYSRLNFGDGDAAAAAAVASRIENHANNGGSLEFWTRANTGGSILRRMAIENDGQVMIGNGSADALLSVNGTASKMSGGTWSTYSDKNLKKNIQEYTDGLAQILQINPVTFQYNGKANITDTESEFVGIIAQELREIAPYTVDEVEIDVTDMIEIKTEGDVGFEPDLRSKRVENYLKFDPNALTYMLINAVKEQQQIIDEKEERIDELEVRLAKIEELISNGNGLTNNDNQIGVKLIGSDFAALDQNVPNPFNGLTRINYEIPTKTTNAQIDIYSVSGKLLKTIPIDHTGKGQINVEVEDMPTGTYAYSLIVDGRKVETKKMVIN